MFLKKSVVKFQVFIKIGPKKPVLYTKTATLLVAQLVEAQRYKSEGRGFDFRLCHWNFSLSHSFW